MPEAPPEAAASVTNAIASSVNVLFQGRTAFLQGDPHPVGSCRQAGVSPDDWLQHPVCSQLCPARGCASQLRHDVQAAAR